LFIPSALSMTALTPIADANEGPKHVIAFRTRKGAKTPPESRKQLTELYSEHGIEPYQ